MTRVDPGACAAGRADRRPGRARSAGSWPVRPWDRRGPAGCWRSAPPRSRLAVFVRVAVRARRGRGVGGRVARHRGDATGAPRPGGVAAGARGRRARRRAHGRDPGRRSRRRGASTRGCSPVSVVFDGRDAGGRRVLVSAVRRRRRAPAGPVGRRVGGVARLVQPAGRLRHSAGGGSTQWGRCTPPSSSASPCPCAARPSRQRTARAGARRHRRTCSRSTARCSPASCSATPAACPQELTEQFRAAGLTHLTAVSGENVAFVLALFAPLLRRSGAARPGRGRGRGARAASAR